MATTTTSIDSQGAEAFAGRVLEHASATFVTILAALGDRLGLFKTLAISRPATSVELASRAGIHERYAREWLGGMATAGYLVHDSDTGRFLLPAEHAPALAEEGGPMFLGGPYEQLLALGSIYDPLTQAFREGGGVPQSVYDERFWEGMERFTAGWYNNHLVQNWLLSLPDVQARLERGAHLADIGCGRGRAILRLVQEFPASRFAGYDVLTSNIDKARMHAERAGVAERVHFSVLDAAQGLPRRFDTITTFDVIHDATDPTRPVTVDSRGPGRGWHLHLSRHQLLQPARGQPRPPGSAILRDQRSLLHDHIARCRRTGTGNARTPPAPPPGVRFRRRRPDRTTRISGYVQQLFNNLYELR